MDGSDRIIQKLYEVETPSYVVSTQLLRKNLEILNRVQKEAGCKIILALKGFATHAAFSVVKEYLPGTTASSINEARLGFEEYGGEVHVYATAYKDSEINEYLKYANHITFNSFSQWRKFRDRVKAFPKKVECAIRINPEYAEVKVPLYNPCYKHSRLGVTLKEFEEGSMDGLSGLHFHTHCASNSDTLERTIKVVEEKFGHLFKKIKWINFGGGHHISRPDYDVDLLIKIVRKFREKHGLEVILEPGEAIALNTGFLVASVVDILKNEIDIAMLDTSASAHMPDVLEMPYRPNIIGGDEAGVKKYTYRLGGLTCLAGDVIGDYSFDKPLKEGDKLILLDMAHYSMVKNNTFNGVALPSIALLNDKNELKVVRSFGYESYKDRLS